MLSWKSNERVPSLAGDATAAAIGRGSPYLACAVRSSVFSTPEHQPKSLSTAEAFCIFENGFG